MNRFSKILPGSGKKQMFTFSSMRSKLILLFLMVSLIPLSTTGMLIYSQTKNVLKANATSKLVAVRDIKANQIESYFETIESQVRTLSADPTIIQAMRDFKASFHTLDEELSLDEGAAEVEVGVARANESRKALTSILQAVETVNQQVEEIAAAAQQMSTSSNELASAMDTVSAVVEENTAATEEMAAGSNEVSGAIENIASVSEENSAAVEEVSAAAEQMSAQVAEVTASAQSLSEMAQTLQQLVAQFKLSENKTHSATQSEAVTLTPVTIPEEGNGYHYEVLPVVAHNGQH